MKCSLCPRKCGVDRAAGQLGYCKMPDMPVVARAAAHFGEEPCISGLDGSGTVFFSGCTMQCCFCQNRIISFEGRGREITIERLAEIFTQLQREGVNNINLVTATHFADKVAAALKMARPTIPVEWNSSGYESLETLKMLRGLVQIYMPDFKFTSTEAARRYASAPDYPEVAKAAIMEMYRQTGDFVLDERGVMQRGVLIRHLVLPGRLDDCFDVIDWIAEAFPENGVLFSLMSQFTPLADKEKFPELSRTLTRSEHERACAYLDASPVMNGFYQDLCSATEEFIPDFDFTGV